MAEISAYDALVRVAEQRGLTVEEVKEEIALVIRDAMSNPDPEVQRRWTMVPKKGEVPTPEEMIEFASAFINDFGRQ